MLFFQQAAVLALSVASLASAHFILETPPPIGFNDENQDLGPCGGIDILDTTNGIRWWPNKGGPVGLITTHAESVWEFKAALRSDTTTWINLSRNITQEGVGSWCIPNIPGLPLSKWQWIGKRGIIQVIQHGHHGALYAVNPIESTGFMKA